MTWAQRRKSGQSRLRLANWWYQRKEYPIAVKCYKKALEYYNDIQTNRECSSAEEYKELLQLMEERLRVMRQVANIFKRIANLIQSGEISVWKILIFNDNQNRRCIPNKFILHNPYSKIFVTKLIDFLQLKLMTHYHQYALKSDSPMLTRAVGTGGARGACAPPDFGNLVLK